VVIDAQDVLITLVTPADTEPTTDATTYWNPVDPPTGDDPLDALIPRPAAAYGDPALLEFHLDDVGSAAGRAAEPAGPTARQLPQWGADALVATVDAEAYEGRGVPVLDLERGDRSAMTKAAAPGIMGSPPSVWGVRCCQYQRLACQKDQASQALP
jgi:hypothetical protein